MASVKKTGVGEALPTLNEVVGEIAPRQVTLGKLDMKLVDAVKKIEEKLRTRLSTRVSTTVGTSFEEGIEWGEILTFGKWDGKWQLLLENGVIGDPEDWNTQPLISVSREKRVQMFTDGFIEKLVREAVAQLDAQIADRQNAVKIANTLIDVLGDDAQGGNDDIPS